MPDETITEILIRRDGCSPVEAKQLLDHARSRVQAGADPEEVLEDEFGLEPDYIFELL